MPATRFFTILQLNVYLADWWVRFTWSEEELQWSNHQLVECRRQLKTVLKKRNTSKNIETQTSSRHGDNQTSHIANNTNTTQCVYCHVTATSGFSAGVSTSVPGDTDSSSSSSLSGTSLIGHSRLHELVPPATALRLLLCRV